MKARRPAEQSAQVPCMDCGGRDFQVTRPGWPQGLRDWLRFGGPWRPPRRVCRQCGNISSSRSYATLGRSRPGWWSVPIRLLQTLRQHRAMTPVPATYLAVAMVGAALGIAAELVLGWPWWLVAAAVVAAVWLFFASTALWGGGSGQPLATDLLRVVSPRRAIEHDHRQEAERFRAAPFPLYGLPPAWSGPRHLGGAEQSWSKGQRRPVTTALGLDHGDPLADQGPQLRVEVRVVHVQADHVLTVRSERRRSLAEELWLAAAPEAHDLAEHLDRLAAARRRPDPAWSRVTIPVNGGLVGFEWLAESRHWVARAELDDRTLTLHARDLPVESVELVRIADLEPYIEGTRRMQEAWAHHHDEDC